MSERKKTVFAVVLNCLSMTMGIIGCLFIWEHRFFWSFFVLLVTGNLLVTVMIDNKNLIRPMSYFILSFIVFVWMRILLNVLLGTSVISVGNGINFANIQRTTFFLGMVMSAMVTGAFLTEKICDRSSVYVIAVRHKLSMQRWLAALLLCMAGIFFLFFLWDSVRKVSIILDHNYLAVSENIMLVGYNYFRFGKYFLLLWILFGKSEKRFFVASTILVAASIGYLLRGARGYAISYFFLWLLFFQKRHSLKLFYLVLAGIALIFLADKVLAYRLGFSVSSGVVDAIVKTLHSQGASIEPVFGVVNFKNELLEIFPREEFLYRNDFGLYIDVARGVNFAAGGFGTSFFAEIYFLGFSGGIFFAGLMAFCVGVMEHAYKVGIRNKEKANYCDILLFMTCPNLVYFARSNIHDYVYKSLSTYVIIILLSFAAKQYLGKTAGIRQVKTID